MWKIENHDKEAEINYLFLDLLRFTVTGILSTYIKYSKKAGQVCKQIENLNIKMLIKKVTFC